METRSERYAKRLSKLIQVETVSVEGVKNYEKFKVFHETIKQMFGNLFSKVDVEDFEGSLIFRWKGKTDKAPILLMSHHDVVEATGPWTHEPFSGDIDDGKVWGRGTLDTKGSLWAMLEAADELIAEGFVPDRDIWFETACTEETDGSGADAITQELKKRGIEFEFVLDEGGMMLYDPIGGADGTFAMIGVAEKGFTDLKFTARSNGGHASTPPKDTPLVRLGKFMAEVDKGDMFTAEVSPVLVEMFKRLAPKMKGAQKFIFKNADKLKWLLCKVMPKTSSSGNALLKTTVAFTMSSGSQGHNVLPQEAFVIANVRYSHHQGEEGSVSKLREIAAKYDIEVEVLEAGFSSHVTDYKSYGFTLVEKAVGNVFGDVTPAPYIMTGASDSRFFSRVSDSCIRFAPFTISHEQMNSIHGVDENVDVSTLEGAVDFYRYIIREV